MADSYGSLFTSVVSALHRQPAIMGGLSPPVRGTVKAMGMSIQASTGIPPESMGPIASDVADTVSSVASMFVSSIASEISAALDAAGAASDVAGAIGSIADVMPLVGTVVKIVIDAVEYGGHGQLSTEEKAAYCQGNYAPVRGTGDIHESSRPCDMFAGPLGHQLNTKNGRGQPSTPSVGDCLMWITEPDTPNIHGKISPIDIIKRYGAQVPPEILDPRLGIPQAETDLFAKMRGAIQATALDKNLDGGKSIFPLYLDLLRLQFDLGRMNTTFAKFLYAQGQDIAGTHPLDNCMRYEQRGYNEAMNLLRLWHNTMQPIHDFQTASAAIAASEGQIVAAAKRKIAGGHPRVTHMVPMRRSGGKIVLAPKKSSKVALAASTTVLGGAAWAAWRYFL